MDGRSAPPQDAIRSNTARPARHGTARHGTARHGTENVQHPGLQRYTPIGIYQDQGELDQNKLLPGLQGMTTSGQRPAASGGQSAGIGFCCAAGRDCVAGWGHWNARGSEGADGDAQGAGAYVGADDGAHFGDVEGAEVEDLVA